MTASEPAAITCTGLSKVYRLGIANARTRLTEKRDSSDRDDREFWALQNVNLEVFPGDVLGVIGRNGAGKSTLLKVLAGITPPTHGEAVLRGRVASLLEVGTGFHPELTGRENVYLSSAIHGLTRRETADRFDSIAQFAGIDEFLDTPVKRYSSGMYVRLGFAVAAHLDPDILLIDEVLAVGDASFRRRCLSWLSSRRSVGTAVVIVSHNLRIIRQITNRAIWVDHGKMVKSGEPEAVVGAFLSTVDAAHSGSWGPRLSDGVSFEKVAVMSHAMEASLAESSRPLVVRLDIVISQPMKDLVLTLSLLKWDGTRALVAKTSDEQSLLKLGEHPGRSRLEFELPAHALTPGHYRGTLKVEGPSGIVGERPDAFGFTIVDSVKGTDDGRGGVLGPIGQWRMSQ